jgi:hypothetical protein
VDKTTIPKGLLKQVYYNLYLPFDMGGNEIVVDEFQNNPAGENLCFWIVDRRMRVAWQSGSKRRFVGVSVTLNTGR